MGWGGAETCRNYACSCAVPAPLPLSVILCGLSLSSKARTGFNKEPTQPRGSILAPRLTFK